MFVLSQALIYTFANQLAERSPGSWRPFPRARKRDGKIARRISEVTPTPRKNVNPWGDLGARDTGGEKKHARHGCVRVGRIISRYPKPERGDSLDVVTMGYPDQTRSSVPTEEHNRSEGVYLCMCEKVRYCRDDGRWWYVVCIYRSVVYIFLSLWRAGEDGEDASYSL